MTNRPILASLCLALCACGGSPTGVSNNCTATLSGPSGAQGGKFSCTISAVWKSSNDQGGISITYGTVGQTDPAIDGSIGFTGEPQARTYSLTDHGATGGVAVVIPFSPKPGVTSFAEWGALNGQGSYSLALSSVSAALTNFGGKTYTVHGALDSTMPPLAGYAIMLGGTVTLHATF
jgi:hypothetical protein